jgi:hypothetical protein
MSEAEPSGAAARLLDEVVTRAQGRARDRVRKLRDTYPREKRKALADRLVKSFSRRAGLGGAATGALSLLSLPVGLPAGVALTLAIEAELLLSLLDLYEIDTSGDAGRVRLYALWAGSGVADAAKNVGLVVGADAVAAVLLGSLPGRIIARLNPALVRLILKRLGLGWLPRAMKLWPIVGAPLGYAIDSAALRALGVAAVSTLEGVVAKPAEAPRAAG